MPGLYCEKILTTKKKTKIFTFYAKAFTFATFKQTGQFLPPIQKNFFTEKFYVIHGRQKKKLYKNKFLLYSLVTTTEYLVGTSTVEL
jgi:hypothetical protein